MEREIYSILKKYKNGNDEPLDGDDVDILVEHLRNKINLVEGNLTEHECAMLEGKVSRKAEMLRG